MKQGERSIWLASVYSLLTEVSAQNFVMISSHIKPLTGVRFLAAFAVVLFHLRYEIDNLFADTPLVYGVISYGNFAVPFFFVLSGFILSHVYFPTYRLADHGRFIWLRFARLWPVHVAMLGAMVLYVGALTVARGYIPDRECDFTVVLPELAMVRSWYDSRIMWNGPAWSIQAEWFAYLLLFPLCALMVRRISNPWALGGLIAVVCVAAQVIDGMLPERLAAIIAPFIIGSIGYRLRAVLPDMRHGALVTALGLVASIITPPLGVWVLCYLAFATFIFGLSYETGWIARILSSRTLIYGGEISFSLYMCHVVVKVWAFEIWDKMGVTGLWLILGTILASLVAAMLVHHIIEVPANEWLRRRLPYRKKPAVAAAFGLSSQ